MAVGVDSAYEGRSMVVLRYLDVVLVAIGAAPALVLGAPVFGYTVGAAAWILQRIIAATDRRLISKETDATRHAGYALFEAFGRIWLLAGAIVLAGVVGHRSDGLTAAIVIFGAYSIALAVRLMSGPPPPRARP